MREAGRLALVTLSVMRVFVGRSQLHEYVQQKRIKGRDAYGTASALCVPGEGSATRRCLSIVRTGQRQGSGCAHQLPWDFSVHPGTLGRCLQ